MYKCCSGLCLFCDLLMIINDYLIINDYADIEIFFFSPFFSKINVINIKTMNE